MLIVYSYYVMDIIHKGHLEYLKNAKALAGPEGRSIVGILTDAAAMEKKPRPILHFEERLELARNIKGVDLVVAQESYSPLTNIIMLRPDVLIESVSHTVDSVVTEMMRSLNGRIIRLPYFPEHSSTKIKEEIQHNV